jgi:hypothetical protein
MCRSRRWQLAYAGGSMRLFDPSRAARLMAEASMDLIVASSRASVGYLSDYWDDDTREDYAMWYPDVTYAAQRSSKLGPCCPRCGPSSRLRRSRGCVRSVSAR